MLATTAEPKLRGGFHDADRSMVGVPVRALSPQVRIDNGLCTSTARALKDALEGYPHAMVIRWGARPNSQNLTLTLLQALYRLAMPEWNMAAPLRIDRSRIAVDEDLSRKRDGVTRLSRSNLAMSLHTDSTYQARPFEVVAMHMARPSPTGGHLTLAPLAPVVDALPGGVVTTLQEPVFPFGRGHFPILAATGYGDWFARYYRQQIDSAVEAGQALDCKSGDALQQLDDCLDGFASRLQMPLQAGDAIFLKNHRVLHGRTGFPATSGRILFRYRMHCPALR